MTKKPETKPEVKIEDQVAEAAAPRDARDAWRMMMWQVRPNASSFMTREMAEAALIGIFVSRLGKDYSLVGVTKILDALMPDAGLLSDAFAAVDAKKFYASQEAR